MHDVHDRTLLPREHVRADAAAHIPGAVEIEVNDRTPAAVADFGGRRGELPPGVIDEDVNGAESLQRRLHERLDLRDFPDIRRYSERGGPQRFDLFHCRVKSVRMAPGDDDIRAEAGEGQGRLLADAASTAGDQNCLPP